MVTKITEAALIAKHGVDVFIVKVHVISLFVSLGSFHFYTALRSLLFSCQKTVQILLGSYEGFILQAGTVHSLKVLKGELTNEIPEDWIGTHIRYNKKHTS